MAIRTKGRRKFVFEGRDFVYYYDEPWSLHVASADKKFVVILFFFFIPWDPQPIDCYPLKVVGQEFPGLVRDGQQKIFLRYPHVDAEYNKPSGIRHLLEWCFSLDKEIVHLKKEHFELPEGWEGDEA